MLLMCDAVTLNRQISLLTSLHNIIKSSWSTPPHFLHLASGNSAGTKSWKWPAKLNLKNAASILFPFVTSSHLKVPMPSPKLPFLFLPFWTWSRKLINLNKLEVSKYDNPVLGGWCIYSPVFFIALFSAMNLGQMLERGKTSFFLLLWVENANWFGTKSVLFDKHNSTSQLTYNLWNL